MQRLESSDQPSLGPGTASRVYDVVDYQAGIVRLRNQFERTIDVTERTNDVGCATGNNVGLAAGLSHFVCNCLHLNRKVGSLVVLTNVGTIDAIQERIA